MQLLKNAGEMQQPIINYMKLTPYLMFNGNCEEALYFYAKVFGGEVKDVFRYEGSPIQGMVEDKQKVMHANFSAKGIFFMAADSGEGGIANLNDGQIHLSINFEDVAEQDKVFNSLSEGGKIVMPLGDQFWGSRFGMLTDKYGIKWMFTYDLKKAGTLEEIKIEGYGSKTIIR